MFQRDYWSSIPIAIALAVTSVSPALAQAITISPASQPIQVSGRSGGPQKDSSCAGFVAPAPNHVVQVTEDTDLRFVLQGEGQLALLIRSSTGKSFCVPADSYSQGKVEIPGRWRKGTYSVFVGDRANESHAYTLQIARSQ
ncbi:MAG: hypothetical protein NW220_07085 [Leptolyngbyaceae cyanobacterium bins.349]|nr:hypothetical protein [Leptolyngbyaceae cyanobacterium bins.349]